MSTWNDENRWYARLMKLAHELAMPGYVEHLVQGVVPDA